MKRKVNNFIYWTPRILSLVFILFLMLFSLDVFSSELNFWQTALALLIHNIPALILLIILIISWKYEIVGGIGFILAGLSYIVILMTNQFEGYMLFWILQISGIAFLIGILFIISWFKKKKQRNKLFYSFPNNMALYPPAKKSKTFLIISFYSDIRKP